MQTDLTCQGERTSRVQPRVFKHGTGIKGPWSTLGKSSDERLYHCFSLYDEGAVRFSMALTIPDSNFTTCISDTDHEKEESRLNESEGAVLSPHCYYYVAPRNRACTGHGDMFSERKEGYAPLLP